MVVADLLLDIDKPTLVWRVGQKITRAGLDISLFPRMCPVCGRDLPGESRSSSLFFHHWGPESKGEAILGGNYKRLCPSCNSTIRDALSGRLLKSGELPWPEQVSRLNAFLSQNRDYTLLLEELPWSRFLPPEEALLNRLLTEWNRSDLWDLAIYGRSRALWAAMLRRLASGY